MLRYLLIILIALLPLSAHADWQSTLEAQFDFVETFDRLLNWKPAGGSSMGDVTSTTHMPKMLDGSDSPWVYFSSWTGTRQANDWIGTQSQVWRAEDPKALVIDYSPEGSGPSRFGLFFGDKQAANPELTGYQEMYMFYMVYIPDNAHPTDGNGVGPASYVQGNDYLYSGYYKFNTFNMGCTGGGQCVHPSEPQTNYSPYHIIPQMQQYPSNNQRLTFKNQFTQGGSSPSNIVQYYSLFSAQPIMTGQWMGVEFHLRNELDGSDPRTVYDVWVYDTDGTATQIASNLVSYYTSQPITELWNHFFFGGNVSFTDSNDSMDIIHIIDDFVIDNQRIGPTYFDLVSQQEAGGDVTAPTVTAFTVPATAGALTFAVNSFSATDDTGVTGYMITESATPPASGDAGWQGTAPTTYTASGAGAINLYAWAKDAAGNVSVADANSTDTITITLPSAAASIGASGAFSFH